MSVRAMLGCSQWRILSRLSEAVDDPYQCHCCRCCVNHEPSTISASLDFRGITNKRHTKKDGTRNTTSATFHNDKTRNKRDCLPSCPCVCRSPPSLIIALGHSTHLLVLAVLPGLFLYLRAHARITGTACYSNETFANEGLGGHQICAQAAVNEADANLCGVRAIGRRAQRRFVE